MQKQEKKTWVTRAAGFAKIVALCTRKGCSLGPKPQPLVLKGYGKKSFPFILVE